MHKFYNVCCRYSVYVLFWSGKIKVGQDREKWGGKERKKIAVPVFSRIADTAF